MTTGLVVLIGNEVGGRLERLSGNRVSFSYEPSYRFRAHATPLSISMPLAIETHSDKVVAPWIAGLLPENEAVLERWSREFHVSAASPFALLGTPVGEDCAGAVRFCGEADVDRLLNRPGDVAWLTTEQVAARLADLTRDTTAWLGSDFTGQFSLAGAQAKTALHFDRHRWGVPSGSTPTTHILKPAIRGFDDHELNEHICLEAARIVGLPVVRTSVEEFGRERAIVVERYDRRQGSSGLIRVHQEDLCQALGVPPGRKYQNEGGPSAEDVIGLLRQVVSPTLAGIAVQRFIDALIWNWVIAGTDAHAKNYSVLLAGDEIRFAPLYDIASALPYGDDARRLKMAMKVGGDYDMYEVRDRWRRAAQLWKVDPEELNGRALAMCEAAPEAFAKAAATPAVRSIDRPGPERLVSLVTDRATRLASFLS